MLYFLAMLFKKGLRFIGVHLSWPTIQLYEDCCEEIEGQLDIIYILRKFTILDWALTKLFEEHELDTLYLRKNPQYPRQRIKEEGALLLSWSIKPIIGAADNQSQFG